VRHDLKILDADAHVIEPGALFKPESTEK